MKKTLLAALGLLISITSSTSSFAGTDEIHLKVGESIKVIVDDCKSSEYAELDRGNIWKISDTVTAKCSPIICKYSTPIWFGTTIRLSTDETVVAKTSSKAETREVLARLIRDGVCAKAQGYGPEM